MIPVGKHPNETRLLKEREGDGEIDESAGAEERKDFQKGRQSAST